MLNCKLRVLCYIHLPRQDPDARAQPRERHTMAPTRSRTLMRGPDHERGSWRAAPTLKWVQRTVRGSVLDCRTLGKNPYSADCHDGPRLLLRLQGADEKPRTAVDIRCPNQNKYA